MGLHHQVDVPRGHMHDLVPGRFFSDTGHPAFPNLHLPFAGIFVQSDSRKQIVWFEQKICDGGIAYEDNEND